MALGNFVASFVNDAFIGVQAGDLAIGPTPGGDGYMVSWRQEF